ncbi:retrovirus-related pol polyprotein from transposon TNT 1-94 [Tanacetum coccineum]
MAYDSDCDDLSLAKAVLMANLSSCYLEVLLCDSNIIWYSQYLQESQDAVIQDTNSSAPNDLLGLSLVEQITDHMKEDFGKRFVTQKELSAEQAFWLKHSSFSETPVTSHAPIRIEVPSELPKCSVDKNDFEIQIKQLSINNDQLLKQIMSQEIMHIAVNSVDSFDVKKSCVNGCNKCLELETELLKMKDLIEKDVYVKLLKRMFKLDIEPISHRLKNNRDAHEVYIEKTIENTDTLRGFVERARTQNPSEPILESGCMFTKHVQEFNILKQTNSLKTKDSNKPLLTSTGVKPTTSASGSKPSGNTKNNKITRLPSSNQKNKVEDHSRKVKSSLNKRNFVSEHVVQLVLWYLDSGYSKYITGNRSQLINFVNKILGLKDQVMVMASNIISFKLRLYQFSCQTWSSPRGLPKLKYQKDNLCSACALGKSKKHSHKSEAEDFIQEKLNLLHMNLCGLMRVQSINGRKYILVIVDDFSRFTWVKFLRSKDELQSS